MSTFAERLASAMAERATIPAAVARAAGIRGASMSDWCTGKTRAENLKAEPLLKAAAFLGVNPMWLLNGHGPRKGQATLTLAAAEPPPVYGLWPFRFIDSGLVHQLRPDELVLLEGAWLNAAKGLGFQLGKPAAA